MAPVTRSSKALHILDNILLPNASTSRIYDQIKASQIYDQIKALLHRVPPDKMLKIIDDPNQIDSLQLVDANGNNITILPEVTKRLKAWRSFVITCQNLAGPIALAPISELTLRRESFDLFIKRSFDADHPVSYDAAVAMSNYTKRPQHIPIPFQDPNVATPASTTTAAATAPAPVAAMQPPRHVMSPAERTKQNNYSPVTNHESFRQGSSKTIFSDEKQAEKNYLRNNNALQGKYRTDPSPSSLTNTNNMDGVSDLRDVLGESLENGIKQENESTTSKEAALTPASCKNAETDPAVHLPTRNKLVEDLIAAGLWENLSANDKDCIMIISDTGSHEIIQYFQEQDEDCDATSNVLEGQAGNNTCTQDCVIVSEVTANDKTACEGTTPINVELDAYVDPLSVAPSSNTESAGNLLSTEHAPPSVDDDANLSNLPPTIIHHMLSTHKARMDEVLQDLDTGYVQDDSFDCDDDSATSTCRNRHVNVDVQDDAPNSTDDAVEFHQYPLVNDGATCFTLIDDRRRHVDVGCNGNVAGDDVWHMDDGRSPQEPDDFSVTDDVGVKNVAHKLSALDVELDNAIEELRTLTEYEYKYKSATDDAKIVDVSTRPSMSGINAGHDYVLLRLNHDVKCVHGHAVPTCHIYHSNICVPVYLDTVHLNPHAAFCTDTSCIAQGIATMIAKLAFAAQSIQFDRGTYAVVEGRRSNYADGILRDLIVEWISMITEWRIGRVTITAIDLNVLGETDVTLLHGICMYNTRAVLLAVNYFLRATSSAPALLCHHIAHTVLIASPRPYHQDDVDPPQLKCQHWLQAFVMPFNCVVWGEITLVQSYLGCGLHNTSMRGILLELVDDDRHGATPLNCYYGDNRRNFYRIICRNDMQLAVGIYRFSVGEHRPITSLTNWGENEINAGQNLRLTADSPHPGQINVDGIDNTCIAVMQVDTCGRLLKTQSHSVSLKWCYHANTSSAKPVLYPEFSISLAVAQLFEENGERDCYVQLLKKNGERHRRKDVECAGKPEGEMKEHLKELRPTTSNDSVDSEILSECNSDEEKKSEYTTMTSTFVMTPAYRARQAMAKENGEPSNYSTGMKLTYSNHNLKSICFDYIYSSPYFTLSQ